MTVSRSLSVLGGFAVLLLLSYPPALEADPITITATGASFTAENDRVILFPATVPIGDPFSMPITFPFAVQPGSFVVDLSPSQSPPHALTLSRLINIDGVSRTVTQLGSLSITPSIDTLKIFDSPVTSFDFGTRGTLFLTLGGVIRSTTVVGQFPFSIVGTLSPVAPTPEPATAFLLGTGIVVAIARRSRLRRRDGDAVLPAVAGR